MQIRQRLAAGRAAAHAPANGSVLARLLYCVCEMRETTQYTGGCAPRARHENQGQNERENADSLKTHSVEPHISAFRVVASL